MKRPIQLRFKTLSDVCYLPFLTRIFKALKAQKAADLTQILVEAFNNAVHHAHHNRKEKWIGVEIHLSKKEICIRITDQGRGIRMKRKKRNDWRLSGRGLALIRAKADHVSHYFKGKRHIFEARRYDA